MTFPPELCIVRNGDIGTEEADSSVFLLFFFGDGVIPSLEEFRFWDSSALGLRTSVDLGLPDTSLSVAATSSRLRFHSPGPAYWYGPGFSSGTPSGLRDTTSWLNFIQDSEAFGSMPSTRSRTIPLSCSIVSWRGLAGSLAFFHFLGLLPGALGPLMPFFFFLFKGRSSVSFLFGG